MGKGCWIQSLILMTRKEATEPNFFGSMAEREHNEILLSFGYEPIDSGRTLIWSHSDPEREDSAYSCQENGI